MIDNEDRADLGIAAVRAAAEPTGVWKEDMGDTAVVDAVSYLCHGADRIGLDAEHVLEEGHRSYLGDFEDGPPARRVADATAATLHELVDVARASVSSAISDIDPVVPGGARSVRRERDHALRR